MITTLDDFSTYFFLPLLLLGAWCLFEGGIDLIKPFFFLRDCNCLQKEELASSLSVDGGAMAHGGQAMTSRAFSKPSRVG